MKRSTTIVLTVVALIILASAGYLIFHKPSRPAASNLSLTPVNNSILITKTSSSLGQYLAEPDGQPLYIYNSDRSGVSNCTGTCLTTWPPYIDTGSTTGLPAGIGTIKRSDNGEIQYTYNGLPLYTFTGDSKGKVTGNGVLGFSVAKPVANAKSNSSSQQSSASSGSTYSNGSSSSSGY